MDELIEVKSLEFCEPSAAALEKSVDERFVPTHLIADVCVNGRNLISLLYGVEGDENLYEEVVGAAVSSLLWELKFEPGKVKTVRLYDCSSCYRCYPIETDAYFLSRSVVWRYFHFPYSVRKTVLIFPKEVYLKGYETLRKLARRKGLKPPDLEKVRLNLKTLKRIEEFELRLGELPDRTPLREAGVSLRRSVERFKDLVADCLFELGFRGGRNEDRLRPAVRFLKLYDPDRLEVFLKLIADPPREKPPLRTLEGLVSLMEGALKRCKELLSRKSSGG
ncbi:MAG: hypothetical protein GXO08_00340 [Aquificae bacterium]|nr:hypothetical protein [Aquificota bacterium]